MKIEIKNFWNAQVLFSFECEGNTIAITLKAAVNAKTNLSDADLRGAVLSGAVLRGADLSGANLSDADLSDADLSGAVLSGAVLSGAVLSGANLRRAVLSGADLSDAVLRGAVLSAAVLSGADLSGAVLSGANLRGVPCIENIHQTIFAAASQPCALNMAQWHTCETTHCRAGWVVAKAGEAGAAMEYCIGTAAAAALIYLKSDPHLEKFPNFYASDEEALADMERLARLEAARVTI